MGAHTRTGSILDRADAVPAAGDDSRRGAEITPAAGSRPSRGPPIRHDAWILCTRFDKAAICAFALIVGLALAGCGLSVSSPDLFLLQRTGQGKPLTILVNDAATIRCNSGPTTPLSDPLLLQARDLATSLDSDAKANLHVRPAANSVYVYTIKLQNGTISFGDTAAATHHELAAAELFALEAAQGPCGLRAGAGGGPAHGGGGRLTTRARRGRAADDPA
jgi:hypothetical protein